MKARLILADDHQVVRHGLREIISRTPDMEVIAEAADGASAEGLVRQHPAELLLLDIDLPIRRGLKVLQSLRSDGYTIPVLFFSMYPAKQYAGCALRYGAQGFVGKDADTATLLLAIRRVLAGYRSFPDHQKRYVATATMTETVATALSRRETEVLQGILQGKTLQSIASDLVVNIKTVSTYRARLLSKLGVSSNVELAAWAVKEWGFQGE